MKTTVFLATICLASFLNAGAQIKIITGNGKVKIGHEPTGISDDPNNVLAMHVYGTIGTYKAGGKIAIGDFGSYAGWGWNTFVGEYRDWDSDQLWLHGKNGIYMTRGRGDDIIGYYDVTVGNKFTFYCDVYSNSTLLTSDARFKTDIKKLDNSLDKLLKLDGVSYKLVLDAIPGAHSSAAPAGESATEGQLTGKGLKAKEDAERLNHENRTRLGLIAQDVRKVFPDLVQEDSSKYLYVDYAGLIPVLIEAVKEQRKTIESLRSKIDDLENCCNSYPTGSDEQKIQRTTLLQNNPNPFSENTTIRYHLAGSYRSAAIMIFDMKGTLLRTYNLDTKTKDGQLLIEGRDLNAGMYIYTLVADNKEIDTKKMILTK